jgi:hypothetical protein
MIDRLFAPLLTFVMLIGGTAAAVSAMFYEPRPEMSAVQITPPTITLETVVITGKRPAAEPVADKSAAVSSGGAAAEHRGLLLRQPRD